MSFLVTQHSSLKHIRKQNQQEKHRIADTNNAALPPRCPLSLSTVNKAGRGSAEGVWFHREFPVATEVPRIRWRRFATGGAEVLGLLHNARQGKIPAWPRSLLAGVENALTTPSGCLFTLIPAGTGRQK